MMIKCTDVTIKYDNLIAVSDISFEVKRGDYLFILGENGGGKSSLIKAILGLIPIHGGEIKLDTDEKIGYLSQQAPSQNDFPATVWEIVLSGCANKVKFFYTKEHKKLAMEKIRALGLYEIRNKCFRSLSGGQKQRTLLARALCSSSSILILDEPVTGLDPKACMELYQSLKDLNKNHGLTVIMVSHDVRAALVYANKILHIDRETVFFGSKDDYIKSGNLDKFFGGHAI